MIENPIMQLYSRVFLPFYFIQTSVLLHSTALLHTSYRRCMK